MQLGTDFAHGWREPPSITLGSLCDLCVTRKTHILVVILQTAIDQGNFPMSPDISLVHPSLPPISMVALKCITDLVFLNYMQILLPLQIHVIFYFIYFWEFLGYLSIQNDSLMYLDNTPQALIHNVTQSSPLPDKSRSCLGRPLEIICVHILQGSKSVGNSLGFIIQICSFSKIDGHF